MIEKNSSDNPSTMLIKVSTNNLLSPSLAEKYAVVLDKYSEKDTKLLKSNTVPTGFTDIDNFMSGGFNRSNLYCINARPSMGKTSLIISIIKHLMTKYSAKILIFIPNEYASKVDFVDRLISVYSGVDYSSLVTGNLTDGDYEKIGKSMSILSNSNIFVNDTTHINIDEITNVATTLFNDSGPDLIVIDDAEDLNGLDKKIQYQYHLHPSQSLDDFIEESKLPGAPYYGVDRESIIHDYELMRQHKIESYFYDDPNHIFKKLEKLAEQLNVPIVCSSVASRVIEERSPQIPTYDDVSINSLKLNAHTILSLYREKYYDPSSLNNACTFLYEIGSSKKSAVELDYKNGIFIDSKN